MGLQFELSLLPNSLFSTTLRTGTNIQWRVIRILKLNLLHSCCGFETSFRVLFEEHRSHFVSNPFLDFKRSYYPTEYPNSYALGCIDLRTGPKGFRARVQVFEVRRHLFPSRFTSVIILLYFGRSLTLMSLQKEV